MRNIALDITVDSWTNTEKEAILQDSLITVTTLIPAHIIPV
jgi:hypothetical protein